MEDYLAKAFRQGLISRSKSPASAGFLFIEKKDSGLRSCIDYRGLKVVTVKYPHLLPLVPFLPKLTCIVLITYGLVNPPSFFFRCS